METEGGKNLPLATRHTGLFPEHRTCSHTVPLHTLQPLPEGMQILSSEHHQHRLDKSKLTWTHVDARMPQAI